MEWMVDGWHTYHKYQMLLFDSMTFTFAGIAGNVVLDFFTNVKDIC